MLDYCVLRPVFAFISERNDKTQKTPGCASPCVTYVKNINQDKRDGKKQGDDERGRGHFRPDFLLPEFTCFGHLKGHRK